MHACRSTLEDPTDGGGPALCAYLTARPGRTVDTKALREGLGRRLPAYMVPAHVVVLPAMPLTPNAKIDRRALLALPAPAAARGLPGAAPAAPPASEIEKQIAGIWQDVLGVAQVGLDDNFFDLGGHSLLTVQAHRRLREATGRDLAITDLFRFPTIRTLAEFLGGTGDKDGGLARSDERADARREAMGRRQQQLQRRRAREGDP